MMTKQQIIDKLNELTDDPNEEIFGWWDGCVWNINDISLTDNLPWDNKKKITSELRIIIDCDH